MATEGYEMPRLMWQHPDPTSTDMEAFRKATNAKYGLNLQVCLFRVSNLQAPFH
jgi:hypothetical protein